MSDLKRNLGLFSLITYYFSTVVGAGIFIVPLSAAQVAGPASIISWVLVLILAYPIALVFSHIAQLFPYSDSIPRFVSKAAGDVLGKTIALLLLIVSIAGTPLLSLTAANHLQHLFCLDHSCYTFEIAIFFVFISTVFNLLGIELSSFIQSFCLLILIVAILLTISLATPHFNYNHLEPFVPHGNHSIVSAVIICFYSVVGWENVSSISEEVHSPYKTYKRAIHISMFLISAFYMLLVIATIMVIPFDKIHESKTLISCMLTMSNLGEYSFVGDALSILLIFLGLNVWIMGPSRLMYALSRDGLLHKVLSKTNGTNNVPQNAVIAQSIILIIILLLMKFLGWNENNLLSLCGLNYMLMYSIIMACGIKYFHSKKWKLLAAFPLVVILFFIPQEIQDFEISLITISLCFLYVKFCSIKNKRS